MKKKSIWTEVILISLFLLTGGCQKEDYTLPVDFRMNFSVSETPVMQGALTIDNITLSLKSIDIHGYRETGGDVFLTRDFNSGNKIEISPGSSGKTIQFDIPQGVYNPIMFSLVYQPDGNEIDLIDDIEEWYEEFEEEDDDDDDDDLDELQEELGEIIEDYLENIEPCIMVKAKFVNNSTTKYVILAVNDPLTFKIISKNINGQAEVILDRNNTNNGNLIFDPSYWFSIITPKILNDAFIGVIDGKKYIFLNKYVNSKIYNSIYNRMEESTSLIINE